MPIAHQMSIGRTMNCLLGVIMLLLPVLGQTAESSNEMAATGYYRDQDTMPGVIQFYNQLPGGENTVLGMGPKHKIIRRSSFKQDAHQGVDNFSSEQRCQKCHIPQTKDLHGLRMGISCVQCHRSQPIAGVYYYYSALNPIRRHAYVCAKCHQGATPSFASYMVHEPNPIASETRHSFPLFYYAVWFMLILAVGVFLFFLPYTVLWWLREFIDKLKGSSNHG